MIMKCNVTRPFIAERSLVTKTGKRLCNVIKLFMVVVLQVCDDGIIDILKHM